MTEVSQDRTRAIVITVKRVLENSAALPLAKPMGMKPAQVINVPVSMGNAVAV